jgi:hypothetical protein
MKCPYYGLKKPKTAIKCNIEFKFDEVVAPFVNLNYERNLKIAM